MISIEVAELIFTASLLVICISYMFLGCAGHKRRTGEESGVIDSQINPEGEPGSTSQAEPTDSKIPDRAQSSAATGSQVGASPVSSIAGYQSQTSEILAGPGEKLDNLSAASNISAASRKGSRLGSRLHSNVSQARSNVGSKFGSTLDSNLMSSRAPGGAGSVLSMLSRSGGSNIQSTLSSNAGRSGMQSNTGRSSFQSTLSGNAGGRSAMQSTLSSHAGRSEAQSNMASNVQSNLASSAGHSNVQSNLASSAGHSNVQSNMPSSAGRGTAVGSTSLDLAVGGRSQTASALAQSVQSATRSSKNSTPSGSSSVASYHSSPSGSGKTRTTSSGRTVS